MLNNVKSHLQCTINMVIVKYEPVNIIFALIQSRNAQTHFVSLKMSQIEPTKGCLCLEYRYMNYYL